MKWILKLARHAANSVLARNITFQGDYTSWEDACNASSGYDDVYILNKVCDAVREVKAGRAVYERDSVLFYSPDYVWPVLSCLNFSAARNKGRLNVFDFGGSLGSLYFQHRPFLERFDTRWTIVEQPHFNKVGREEFATDRLRFIDTLPDSGLDAGQSVLLLSSVLQYLKQPHHALRNLLALPWSMVILDRTAFTVGHSRDRLTVQRIPAEIYSARYPAWFFSESHLQSHFKNFELLATWKNSESFRISGATTVFKGMCYVRKGIEHDSK